MTDEQIVGAAKKAEQKTRFGELVHSQVSRGVNSAYGIGFLEGAEWVREQMMKGALEYEVGMHGEPIKITFDKYVQRARGIFPGDKVRVIVWPKKDEK